MRRNAIRRAAASIGLALVLSACTGGSGGAGPRVPDSSLVGAAASTTKAADLRAQLTRLLAERSQLVGLATHTALLAHGKLTAPSVTAAVAALDANSVALSKVFGAAYPIAEAPFLALWRQHAGFLLDYTLAKASKSAAKVAAAQSHLDSYRTAFGTLLSSVVPELPAADMANELKDQVVRQLAAIDAQVAGSPRQFALLQDTASHTWDVAAIFAAGIATNLRLGVTDRPAADLRAGLTALLTQHVYATGIAVDAVVAKGGKLDDPLVRGAVAALDSNSIALSRAIGTAYPKAEAPFLEIWRQQISFLMSYSRAKATGSRKQISAAKADLDGYRSYMGELIHSLVPELAAQTVAEQLQPGVARLLAAIDADVAGDSRFFAKLAKAADDGPTTARFLAGGIAQDRHLS